MKFLQIFAILFSFIYYGEDINIAQASKKMVVLSGESSLNFQVRYWRKQPKHHSFAFAWETSMSKRFLVVVDRPQRKEPTNQFQTLSKAVLTFCKKARCSGATGYGMNEFILPQKKVIVDLMRLENYELVPRDKTNLCRQQQLLKITTSHYNQNY